MNRNISSIRRNQWLQAFRLHGNKYSDMKQSEIFEKFGSIEFEGYRNGDREQGRKKKLFPMFENDKFGEETELFVRTNMAFIEYADEVGWDGHDKILNYRDLLGGKLRRKYKGVGWNGVHDHYDPTHANAETDDGFVRLLQAFFMEITGHDNPAFALQEKIKGMKYMNQSEHDTLMDPKHYKEKIEDLMEVAEVLPHPTGWQPAGDLDWLNAIFYGLPEKAQDYLKYVKDVDPFDAEHNGANALDWDECLMEIRPWWVANYQKIAEENMKKKLSNKRDRDDDEDDNRSNKRRKQNTDRNDDDSEDEQDDEEVEQDDDEHQDDYSTYSTDDENQDDESTQPQEDQRGRSHDKKSDDDKLSFFEKPCLIHHNHPYSQCSLCFSGKQFNRAEADKYYQNNDSHSQGWWRRTYERKFPQQEQQQSYYQQYSAPPGQFAPAFATGTAAPASATTGTAAQAKMFRQVQDTAGNSYWLQM